MLFASGVVINRIVLIGCRVAQAPYARLHDERQEFEVKTEQNVVQGKEEVEEGKFLQPRVKLEEVVNVLTACCESESRKLKTRKRRSW